MIEENGKRITKWAHPLSRMEATITECPECGTVAGIKHDFGCSKPNLKVRHVSTTQFGPCSFGEWCDKLMAKLNAIPGRSTEVKKKGQEVALFDC